MTAVVTFDWSPPWHWDSIDLLCRYCLLPTHLRDDTARPRKPGQAAVPGRPAHKVCAERAYEQRLAREAAQGKEPP
ncbi:hypothetical protein ABH931_006089 [Streptacidiphilus sp. MAP12-33]|uniref:hypothetical protein n=1 Tax=Streptacidiphilus sp. MAP12-33 TaxID=3156266 RepID=UPI00351779D9